VTRACTATSHHHSSSARNAIAHCARIASVVVEAAHQQRRNPGRGVGTQAAELQREAFLPNAGAKSSGAGVICSDTAAPDSAREDFFSIDGVAELRRWCFFAQRRSKKLQRRSYLLRCRSSGPGA
jgi:hypothetical protein